MYIYNGSLLYCTIVFPSEHCKYTLSHESFTYQPPGILSVHGFYEFYGFYWLLWVCQFSNIQCNLRQGKVFPTVTRGALGKSKDLDMINKQDIQK